MTKEKFTRENLSSLLVQGQLLPRHTDEALSLSGISPSAQSWHQFIETLLLWLGTLALALALMFFVAFNWSELGRFAQFALVEAAIILAMAVYYKMPKESLVATASLVLASLFLGVLLALYGQTYQTGADTWQLFFTWALLILPWTLLAKLPAQWILWITLLNLSIGFYFESHVWVFSYSGTFLLWTLFIFNLSVHILWELSSHFLKHEDSEAWYIRLLVLAAGVPLTWLMFVAVVDKEPALGTFVVWVLYLSALYVMYKRIKPDLFILAWGCFSAITIIITFLARHILKDFNSGGLLLLTLTVIALGTASAYWLKHLHKEFNHA